MSDPLGLLDICATSDGAAALVVSQPRLRPQRAARPTPVRVAAVSTVTPALSADDDRAAELRDRLRAPASAPCPSARLQGVDRRRAPTRRPGIGPDDLDCAEVYDLSTAMELDWYEQIGLCAPGEAEKLRARRRDHASAAASR